MNERIQALQQQAMSIVLNGNDPDSDVDKMYIPSEFTKKFAELIVAECMEVFSKDLPEPGDGKMLEVVNRVCAVAEHFGVEE